jgi:hypothetical protein
MKKFFATTLTIMAITVYGSDETKEFLILDRKDSSTKTIIRKAYLDDLISSTSFEGKYVKIVRGKSSTPISFTDRNNDIILKAATVYYHLGRARKYWIEKIKSTAPLNLPQITVRLEITNLFDSLGHFAHDNRDPQYNNALSIPSGESPDWVPESNRRNWSNEIWLRPMKKIETKDLPSLGPNPLTLALSSIEGPFINFSSNRFRQKLLEHIFYPDYAPGSIWQDGLRFAGTIALSKVILESTKKMDSLFSEKYYYLDSAMVPEIIYHEYAHLILSDNLELTHSTPVIEGMADYFAAGMAKKRQVYARVKNRSNANSKDKKSKVKYRHWLENNQFATSDFTLSVLWSLREVLGEEKANEVIYEARKDLKTSSATIYNHLLNALLKSCERVCNSPFRDKLMMIQLLEKKGF